MKFMQIVPTQTGWADEAELLRNGVQSADTSSPAEEGGVILASDKDTILFDGGREKRHSLIIGASGGGKSRLVIIPSIISMLTARKKESIVITDVKGELEAATRAIAEQEGYQVLNIDFENPSRCKKGWNPFYKANDLFLNKRRKDEAWVQLEKIFSVIFRDGEHKSSDPFWRTTSASICRALSDLIWRTGKPITSAAILKLSEKLSLFRDDDDNCEVYAAVDKLSRSSIARSNLEGFRALSDVNRGSVYGTYRTYLSCLTARKDLMNMLSCEDSINLQEIGQRPTVLYISMPDDNAASGQLQGLLIDALLQELNSLAKQSENLCLPVHTEFVLDEVCNITPPIASLPTALAIARSRGMRFTLACQSYSQLVNTYGVSGHTIAENCANWIALFISKDEAFRSKLSALCGVNDYNEPVITPSELALMPYGTGIVIRERCHPYYTQLIDYAQYPARPQTRQPSGEDMPQAC